MNKNMKRISLIVFVAFVIASLSFYAGTAYQKRKTPNIANNSLEQRMQQFGGRGGNGGGPLGRGGMGGGIRNGGLVNGEVMLKDAQSMVLKLRDGGSRIVFFSASTTIGKMTEGSWQDVVAGSQVMVAGSTNADGSMTAQSIQMRPNIPTTASTSGGAMATSSR